MKKFFALQISIMLIITQIFTGCASIKNQYPENSIPASMSFGPSLNGSKDFIRHFEVSERKVFWFFYLIPHSKFNAYDLAQKQIGSNEEITNLKIETKMDFVDCLISIFGIIIGTWKINVSGDVVKK